MCNVKNVIFVFLRLQPQENCKNINLCNKHRFHMHGSHTSCVDPEGGGAVFRTPIEKSQNYRVSLQFWTRSPEKLRSYRASIQCRAIISTPAKRHFMAFRWRADDDPLIVVFGSSHHSSTKKKNWTPSDKNSGSAHVFWLIAF